MAPTGNASEFFGSLTLLRSGGHLSQDVVQRAKEHCKGGTLVADLCELYSWMQSKNPEMSFFDAHIATGAYPASLAAFVTACPWEQWKKHAVYALHGEIYLARLNKAHAMMEEKVFRDHFAGASMHRANGLMHMVRCADGREQLELPCWDKPWNLIDVANRAVADMRTTCRLRSEKYGQPGCSEGTVKAFQASLQNLADALETWQTVSANADVTVERDVARLRERATNLSLTDTKILAACSAGSELAARDQASIAREVRLGDSAMLAVAPRQEHEFGGHGTCERCPAVATHHGFSCRCLCMCADCVAAAGSRIVQCPICEEFTEFVRA